MQLVKKLSILICSLTVLGGCASGLSTFEKGRQFEQTGELDKAVIKYAEAAAANPGMSEYRLRFLKVSADAARLHMVKGDDFFATNNYDDALREYQTSYALDPSLERSKQQIEVTGKLRNAQIFSREGAELEKNGKTREALRSYRKALEFSHANKEAQEGVDRILKTRRPKLDGYELNLKSTKPITLKFKDAKIKDVFSIITKLSGINFIFDEGVKDVNFSIFLENATFQQAMDVITELNKLGTKILNETSVIIYPRNPEKNKQYEELYLQTFYLNKIDAKKAVNLLRTMMQIKKIYVNEELNAIVVRDTPEVVELAGKILEANDIPDAEVVLDVEVIELTKGNEENLGFVLSRYAVSAQGFNNNNPFADVLSATTSTSATTAAGPSNLLQLFAWKQFSGFLTVPNASFNFAKTLANGETLANPKIRVKNREKAKFTVGSRIPITTTSSPTGGGITTSVQYVDVGVKLNAEPTIQLNDEISIKMSMEVSTAGPPTSVGGTGTTVVTIGTRNLDTVLSLKDGETSIIGGLIQDARSKGNQKIALLGDIPIIGSLFAGHTSKNDKTELVLAITPHIVRGLVVPDPTAAAFWTGKEDDPSTVKLFTSFKQEEEIPQALPEPAAPSPPKAAPPAPKTPEKVAPPAAAPPAVVAPPAAAAAPAPPAAAAPVAPPAAPPVPSTQALPPVSEESLIPTGAVLNIVAPQTTKINEEFRVEVVVSDVVNLHHARFALEFDSTLVDFVRAAEGTFLKKDGKPTSFAPQANQEIGLIDINLGRVGDVGGVSGAGTLAVITFKAKAKGSVNLGFESADFYATGGEPLDADIYSAVTEVQ